MLLSHWSAPAEMAGQTFSAAPAKHGAPRESPQVADEGLGFSTAAFHREWNAALAPSAPSKTYLTEQHKEGLNKPVMKALGGGEIFFFKSQAIPF